MENQPRCVKWIGRETVRVELGSIAAELTCYSDNERNALIAILGEEGTRNGIACVLSETEIESVGAVLREELGVRRLFGIAFGRRDVHVQRASHVS